MGFSEYLIDSVSVSAGTAESRRFGISIVNVRCGRSAQPGFDLGQTLLGTEFDLAVVRFPSGNTEFSSQLSTLSHKTVVTDPTVYWSSFISPEQRPTHLLAETQFVRTDSIIDVAEVVSSSFHGYRSHWHHNPMTSRVNMVDVYVEWLQSVEQEPSFGTFLLKSALDGQNIGMALLEFRDSFVEVLLAGVSAMHQGRGHYSVILEGVERVAQSRGLDQVVISTQASNINVQRAWSRKGWVPEMALQTVHLVKETM